MIADKISLQHEVRSGYPGCSKCHKKHYPYYLGSDKKYYCEDCAAELVKLKVAQFGRLPKQNYCPCCGGSGRISQQEKINASSDENISDDRRGATRA
jgi:DnaJ-class molecular chaperone